MKRYKHTSGTVIGDYKRIMKKHYFLSEKCENEVATLVNYKPKDRDKINSRYLTSSEAENYAKSRVEIAEFSDFEGVKQFKESMKDNRVAVVERDGRIVSGATLCAISDRMAVIIAVFTLEKYRGNGYAREAVKLLLEDYASTRTIFIFFTNPVAKKLYLDMGFKVEDKLIMFENK